MSDIIETQDETLPNKKPLRNLLTRQIPLLAIPIIIWSISIWYSINSSHSFINNEFPFSFFYSLIWTITNAFPAKIFILPIWIFFGISGIVTVKKYIKTTIENTPTAKKLFAISTIMLITPIALGISFAWLMIYTTTRIANESNETIEICESLTKTFQQEQQVVDIKSEIGILVIENDINIVVQPFNFRNYGEFDTIVRDELQLIGKQIKIVMPLCNKDFRKAHDGYNYRIYTDANTYPAQVYVDGKLLSKDILTQ